MTCLCKNVWKKCGGEGRCECACHDRYVLTGAGRVALEAGLLKVLSRLVQR